MKRKKQTTNADSPARQLATFIAKFEPANQRLIRAALRKVRARVPNAIQLVYDNYNALVIGFGPSERASEAIFSIAAYASGVGLCFLQGANPALPDPEKLLQGSGTVARHVHLDSAATLDRPAVKQLMTDALRLADVPIAPTTRGRLIIRSISAKQRPRR
jgi:hypothetical protein